MGKNLIKISCYLMIPLLISPFIQHYVTFPFSAIPLVLLIVGVFLEYNKRKIQTLFILLVLIVAYSIILYLGVWQEITEFSSKIWSLIFIWYPLICVVGLLEYDNKKLYKSILRFSLLLIIITCITTIMQLNQDPMASRYLATGRSDLYEIDKYLKNNVGGYGFIYSLVLLIPGLIYMCKKKIFSRTITLTALIIILFCIYKSQYTIAIVLSACLLPLFLLKPTIKIGKLIVVASVILIVFRIPIGNSLVFISSKIDTYFIKVRLAQLASLLLGTNMEGSDDRILLYMESIRAFKRSPFLGRLSFFYPKLSIGGHSEFFDLLGATGIIGASLFMLICFYSYKKVFSTSAPWSNLFFKTTILFFLILGTINTIHSPMLFPIYIIWLCIFSIENKESKNENIVVM